MFGSVVLWHRAEVRDVLAIDVYSRARRHVVGEHGRILRRPDDVLITRKKVLVSAGHLVDARTCLCLFEERIRVAAIFEGPERTLIKHEFLPVVSSSSVSPRWVLMT